MTAPCPQNCTFAYHSVVPPTHCPHCGRCLGCGGPWVYPYPVRPTPLPCYGPFYYTTAPQSPNQCDVTISGPLTTYTAPPDYTARMRNATNGF